MSRIWRKVRGDSRVNGPVGYQFPEPSGIVQMILEENYRLNETHLNEIHQECPAESR
jgi:hypothetical protein